MSTQYKWSSGRAVTTLIIKSRFSRPSMGRDIREYVKTCGCRMRKRSNSRKVSMLPARFLRPWEVMEMNIQDMHQLSSASHEVKDGLNVWGDGFKKRSPSCVNRSPCGWTSTFSPLAGCTVFAPTRLCLGVPPRSSCCLTGNRGPR